MKAMLKPNSTGILWIVGVYIALGLGWILASDWIAQMIGPNSERFQTIKGSFYVLATAGLLWIMIARHERSLQTAASEIHRRQTRLNAILEGTPIPLVVVRHGVGMARTIEDSNRAAQRLLGAFVSPGRALADLVPKESSEQFITMMGSASASGKTQVLAELNVRSATEGEILVRVEASPVDGSDRELVLTFVDLREQKKLEAIAREAHRMEAVGTFAAGLTHEFNNLLTSILGLAALGRQGLEPNSPAARALERIQQAGSHASGISRSLLTLCRSSPSVKHTEDLAQVIHSAIDLIRGVMPGNIEIVTETADLAGARADLDAAQIRQALLNMAINSRDAMTAGGRLTIRGRIIGSPPKIATPRCAEIVIEDTGEGMDAATRARVFEPFFTTKPAGIGTGLGMPLALGVVQEHGGTIDLWSERGQGTRVTIRLPLIERAAVPTPSGSALRGKLIVIGEDNTSVRRLIEDALQGEGVEVAAMPDGESVLSCFLAHKERVAAMVLDVGLPGASGVECMIRARKVRPDLPVVLATGGSMPDVPPEMTRHTAFLAKPFTLDELATTVNAMIESGEAVS